MMHGVVNINFFSVVQQIMNSETYLTIYIYIYIYIYIAL